MNFIKTFVNISVTASNCIVARQLHTISVVRVCKSSNLSQSYPVNCKLHDIDRQQRQQNASIFSRHFNSSIATRCNTGLQLKKRPVRKKRLDEELAEGKFNVIAFATADEYELEALHTALTKQDLYETRKFFTNDDNDVLHVRAKYQVESEPRDIFFFREGSVVLWNCSDMEAYNVIKELHKYEIGSYAPEDINSEKEIMNYNYTNDNEEGHLRNGDFYIRKDADGDLEKYTFSNALTSSVKLGIWEALLDKYIDGISFVTTDLKEGRKIRMTRGAVLRKTGELFALRHEINLNSNLLDTPDFYWERDNLEQLFLNTCSYFNIPRRKRVCFVVFTRYVFFDLAHNIFFEFQIINEKINHCIELTDLVSSNLNDAHHVRLEWMIIVLIMVEVGFETLHYIERSYQSAVGVHEL